ncbi:MAG TPA: YtxH domain-containing protein [Vicinamibacteria bacterium]|nr:YtxH domain-containing protein [Vicinamibacteria bacterium]
MKDESGNFLVGFFVGVALGGIAALLLAPKSGKKLRRDVSREGRKLAHRASEMVEEIRDKGVDAYEKARELVG